MSLFHHVTEMNVGINGKRACWLFGLLLALSLPVPAWGDTIVFESLTIYGTLDVGVNLILVTEGYPLAETDIMDGSIMSSAVGDPGDTAGNEYRQGMQRIGWLDNNDGSTLFGYTVAGDANMDGVVDDVDLGLLASAWGSDGEWGGGDFNYDSIVNVIDLGALATQWGADINPPAAMTMAVVPEPFTMSLLAIGSLVVFRRRRS